MPATMTRPADRTEMMPKTARSACLTLLLAIGLAGPARAQPTETPLPAPGTSAHRWGAEVCVIRVPVADCMAAGGIQLDRPLVEGRDIARLRWTIDTPSFTFANVCAVHRRTGRRIRGPTGGSTERVAGAQPQRDHGRVPVRPHAHGPGLPARCGVGCARWRCGRRGSACCPLDCGRARRRRPRCSCGAFGLHRYCDEIASSRSLALWPRTATRSRNNV